MVASSPRSRRISADPRQAPTGSWMRPGCWFSPVSSTSTRTRASPPTRSLTGSSRIRWPPRTEARPRSSRSTIPARDRRQRQRGPFGPAWPSGAPPPTPTARSTTASHWRCRATPMILGRTPRHHRRRRFDIEGLHGVRLPPARPAAVRCDAPHGPARRHAPGPLRGPGAARLRRRRIVAAW